MKYLLMIVLLSGCVGPRAHYCPLLTCSLGQQMDIKGPVVEDHTKESE